MQLASMAYIPNGWGGACQVCIDMDGVKIPNGLFWALGESDNSCGNRFAQSGKISKR
jgi:hypothetical protein